MCPLSLQDLDIVKGHVGLFPLVCLYVGNIYLFLYIELSLHLWDKAYLIMVLSLLGTYFVPCFLIFIHIFREFDGCVLHFLQACSAAVFTAKAC